MLGIPLPFAVFFTFLGLRLSHTVDWSWWWVTAPVWISAAIFAVLLLVLGIASGVFLAKWASR